MKSDRQQPSSLATMGRLIRLLFAIVIATVLVEAPSVQAAIVVPCNSIATAAADHLLSSGQAPISTPAPCKGTMPGCPDMLGCAVTAGLPTHTTTLSHELTWTSALYWAIADVREGLSVKPDLGPPITI